METLNCGSYGDDNVIQCACQPTLSSHLASTFKTKVWFILNCARGYNTLCSAQHQEKDPYMSELSCSTLLLASLAPRPVTPERALQTTPSQHYSLFFPLVRLLGDSSEENSMCMHMSRVYCLKKATSAKQVIISHILQRQHLL